ncbi:hypothetical protein QBC42DRAFT_179781, partial [Cladorrhinum samala]
DDHYSNMLWLDSTFPTDPTPTQRSPARAEAPAAPTVACPSRFESAQSSDKVTHSNIKFGPIRSTFKQ